MGLVPRRENGNGLKENFFVFKMGITVASLYPDEDAPVGRKN